MKGIIQGRKVDAERGQVWRVHLSDMPDNQADDAAAAVPKIVRVAMNEMRQEYREWIADLEEKNERTVAAAAHWQARAGDAEQRAQHAEEQVKLLMAPKDEPAEEQPAAREPTVSWWKRVFGGSR